MIIYIILAIDDNPICTYIVRDKRHQGRQRVWMLRTSVLLP